MKRVNYISILFVSFMGLISACSSSEKKTVEDEKKVPVVVATPLTDNRAGIQVSGQVEAGQTAMISTRVMGTITSVKVKAGDLVKQGQLLATIANDDMKAKKAQVEASVAEAEAAAAVATKDLERFTQLYNSQSASAKELENVKLQHRSILSKLESARQMRNEVHAMLAYTEIKAPFPGVITQKFAEEGSMANPGMPILALEQTKSFQALISVPETDVMGVKPNGEAIVTVKATGTTFTGILSEVSPSSQFTGGQYLAKVAIPDNEKENLKAGMYVNVFIPFSNEVEASSSSLTIPLESVIKKEDLTGVYVLGTDDIVSLRWIRLGKSHGDRVDVLSGLNKEETFVVKAEGRIYNGAKVSVVK
ncbi:MAG: efflux RND transporter periplasmic adaptor subunit [Bacteroidales bacterium]|nr:efflux RND transporter periplasmic adaptor subunit [Bacteroidales bacterium]